MKALKAGEEPKRGNPNNDEDQEEFDTNEGPDSKQPVRASTKGGYSSLGPAPDLGLPNENSDEESKSNKSSSDDDSEESDEPPPMKKEIYKPPPPKPAAKAGKSSKISKKKGKEFYKAIEQAKKHARNCISNLGYNKVQSSIDELEEALEILRELED